MKLIEFLNEKIAEDLVLEYSDKIVQTLLKKYKATTNDDDNTILRYIEEFEKLKGSLPVEKRNIEQYSYFDLKKTVQNKKIKTDVKNYVSFFKKKTKGVPLNDMIKTIRKFLEIQEFLPKPKSDITGYDYLDLVGFLEKNFEKVMSNLLLKKFEENTNFTNEQKLYYVSEFFNIFNDIPLDTRLVKDMNAEDIEHLIDGLSKGTETSDTQGIKDIELLYDDNNLKIFAPKTKDQCILLRHGRSWCTSRDGSSNLYYNYRLNNNLTLYYVINEDLPYSDVNFASVILVEPDGYGMRLADGTNSGTFSGHQVVPWEKIVSKIPKLKNLKDLFKPKPLTQEEKETINKVRNVTVGIDPMQSFENDEKMVELWLEISSPHLSDTQYSNLPPTLQKKYISLGFELSPSQVKTTKGEAVKYLMSRKIDLIKNKSINDLTSSDISLLNLPLLSKLKEELKSKFIGKMSFKGASRFEIDNLMKSDAGKFIAMYGFDELIEGLPDDISVIHISNKNEPNPNLKLPKTISKFKSLKTLFLENLVDNLEDSICELDSLEILSLPNNVELKNLPECLSDLPYLVFINLAGSPNVQLPKSMEGKAHDYGDGLWEIDI